MKTKAKMLAFAGLCLAALAAQANSAEVAKCLAPMHSGCYGVQSLYLAIQLEAIKEPGTNTWHINYSCEKGKNWLAALGYATVESPSETLAVKVTPADVDTFSCSVGSPAKAAK